MEQEGRLAVFGYPLLDPLAACHACGQRGTVGRAIRKQGNQEVFHAQICASCWPGEFERLSAEWDALSRDRLHRGEVALGDTNGLPETSVLGAATWHGIERFIREQLLPPEQVVHPAYRTDLAAIAREYQQLESE